MLIRFNGYLRPIVEIETVQDVEDQRLPSKFNELINISRLSGIFFICADYAEYSVGFTVIAMMISMAIYIRYLF